MSETASTSESFTCNTCGLAFQAADFQRDHMKTEWHRYNLKRRVAGLPPIPSEVFAEKLLTQNTDEQPVKQRQVTKKELKRQEKERRRLASSSRASSLTSAMSDFSLGDPTPDAYTSDDEPIDEEEAAIQQKLRNRVEIPANVCFMDGHVSDSVEANVEYLERKFGLVIPEPNYVADLAGLVQYINEKVGLGNCCLYCSFMGRSVEAARAHMTSKQHCKIPYDSEAHKEELEEFYDFSSSYADDGAGDGWEDTDEEGEGDMVVREDDLEDPSLYASGYELEVAPGKVAGHRDLRLYYRQYHAAKPKESAGRRAVKMIDLRSPGVTEKAAEKMVKESWKENKRADRARLTHDKHINFQKHFRDPLLQ